MRPIPRRRPNLGPTKVRLNRVAERQGYLKKLDILADQLVDAIKFMRVDILICCLEECHSLNLIKSRSVRLETSIQLDPDINTGFYVLMLPPVNSDNLQYSLQAIKEYIIIFKNLDFAKACKYAYQKTQDINPIIMQILPD